MFQFSNMHLPYALPLFIFAIVFPTYAVRSFKSPFGKQPNILFLMADDLGWADVSWHDPQMATPYLHNLAYNGGVILNQSYVCQLCSPTRASFFTGYYPHHTGTQKGVFYPMEPSGVPKWFKFFPERLRDLGYKTYMVGKWHVGYCNSSFVPTGRGFDYFMGYYSGQGDYFTHRLLEKEGKGRDPEEEKEAADAYDFWENLRPDFSKEGHYSTEIFADKTIELLSKHDRRKPFFHYMAFQTPHIPLQVPQRYISACNQTDTLRRAYCAMIYAMDVAVTRVVEYLKREGLYDNTVIIFSTDNGGFSPNARRPNITAAGSNLPLKGGKATLWEGGTRAVNFFHAPAFLKNFRERNELFHIVDWYATLLTLAGKPTAAYGDGINQLDMILTGKTTSLTRRSGLIYNIMDKMAAFRLEKYKLIQLKGSTQLYDLEKDPIEAVDLAAQQPRLVRVLKLLLAEFRKTAVPSVHKKWDMKGSPKHFNGTLASGWCI